MIAPFTVKEHVLITVRYYWAPMFLLSFILRLWSAPVLFFCRALISECHQASVGAGSAYATDIIAVQRVYYKQQYNFSCEILLYLSAHQITNLLTRSMVCRYVDATYWVLNWRHRAPVPCHTALNDLAFQPR